MKKIVEIRIVKQVWRGQFGIHVFAFGGRIYAKMTPSVGDISFSPSRTVGSISRYIGFLMVYGDGAETITLRAFDHNDDEELSVANASLTFAADAVYGSPSAPYVIMAIGSVPDDHHLIVITTDGNGIANANAVSAPQGATVALTATANSGYKFKEWVVETWQAASVQILPDATANPATFTMPDEAVEIKAHFEETSETPEDATFIVTISSEGSGALGTGRYASGEIVTISAGAPPTGQQFKNWTWESPGVILSDPNGATTIFVMPQSAVALTANFENSVTTGYDGKT